MRTGALAVVLAVALLMSNAPAMAAAAAPQSATTPQTTLADIEDEVMCPICGTLLELANSPQAEREKAFIAKLVAAGESKSEIKDELVAQYGRRVLALPDESGFDLSAYLVPIVALLIAAIALAIGVVRWRKRGASHDSAAVQTGPQGEDARRLEEDLSRYDL